jgi:2-dehydro-3-deoxyglucarate aldolase/4-hydroxy-2-oxoheptanedioate aldolase
MRSFREMLAADELVRVFAAGRLFHPIVFDVFALAGGYHGFWLDGEHVQLSTEQMINAAQAARANNWDCFARIPPIGYWHVTQCLETGMGGVMAAQIRTTAEADQFVQWAKFPPRGVRGLNLGGRDADHTFKPAAEFVVDANDQHLVAIQIETLGALDEVDQIAALDGVDHLFIGPADLSLALGVVGQYHHERVWEAMGSVAQASRRHGKTWGALAPDPRFADRAVEQGARLVTLGVDLLAMRRGVEALKAGFANQFGE